jgi:sugar/nucleoside kinase (ribokinase family)
VLVVGAASRDLTATDPRGWRLGGAVTYGSLTLARLGLRVRALIGVDAEAAVARELDLLSRAGVAIALAPLASGPVFENVETPAGRRQMCHATSDELPLTSIPRAWTLGNDAMFLAPVAAELPDGWADLAAGSRHVALGWQGLLREVVAGAEVRRVPPAPSRLLDAGSLVGVSRDDLAPAAGRDSLPERLGHLAPGATLVVTEATAGGRVLGRTPDGAPVDERYPAIPSDRTADPTGAGDVFLASMLAARLDPALGSATQLAAAAASLVVEAPALDGVPYLDAVRRRMTRPPSLASRRPSAVSNRASGRPSQA